MKNISRFKELTCVLFGHEWNSHGSTTSDEGLVLEEYYDCDCCGLRNYDGSGYREQYKKQLLRHDVTRTHCPNEHNSPLGFH